VHEAPPRIKGLNVAVAKISLLLSDFLDLTISTFCPNIPHLYEILINRTVCVGVVY